MRYAKNGVCRCYWSWEKLFLVEENPNFEKNACKVCIGNCVFMCGYTSRHDISISLEPTDTKLSRYLTNHILLIFTKGFVDISLITRSTVFSSSIVFIKRFWQSGKKMGYKQLKLWYWHFTVTLLKENMFRKRKNYFSNCHGKKNIPDSPAGSPLKSTLIVTSWIVLLQLVTALIGKQCVLHEHNYV